MQCFVACTEDVVVTNVSRESCFLLDCCASWQSRILEPPKDDGSPNLIWVEAPRVSLESYACGHCAVYLDDRGATAWP